MSQLQKYWGGRYNPMVPVVAGEIEKSYRMLLAYYDPDYVFYSDGVELEAIQKLRLFNPKGFYNLDSIPREENIYGVDSMYFLSLFDRSEGIIMPSELWRTKSLLLDYLDLNFGISSNGTVSDYNIAKQYHQINFNEKNFDTFHEIVFKERPINRALLSRNNLNTVILRSLKDAQYNDFVLVIAKDTSSISDLLYFWNRLLYQGDNTYFVTLEQLKILVNDKFFGTLLYREASSDFIKVCSTSFSKADLKALITELLLPISRGKPFIYHDCSSFPYKILDANGLYESDFGESENLQTFVGQKAQYAIPMLSFTNNLSFYPQKWAIDIKVRCSVEDKAKTLLMPLTYDIYNVFPHAEGRINRSRTVTLFIRGQRDSSHLDISIPETRQIVSQLISRPIIQGKTYETKFIETSLHDDSRRLISFIKLFNHDFKTIADFFSDNFWVSLLEEYATTNRSAGSAFTFVDLKSRAFNKLVEAGYVFKSKEESRFNEENLELGLKNTLTELCNYQMFFKGYLLKCKQCSSTFYYYLNEVDETVKCKGCLQSFTMPVEPNFAYKLNDLIKNNIYRSRTERDGNLTVIRTLASISAQSRRSFEFSPQINLYLSYSDRKPYTDIDIFCISDGKLIIGEAKHSSVAFFDKNGDGLNSLQALANIAKDIRPDKILITCYEDDSNKLKNAGKTLEGLFYMDSYAPEIQVKLLPKPDDFALGPHQYFYY
ncbi:hypothetical protein GN157_11135 [Flavobacterium rakeshii]|uniref:Uncharacterized protein n=1 Tax=Flavobacterium rakeshii TaxID=1038845 RepID=A0A6N8HEX5_9FLAO|nr:hypothetical protein [Flavobacterium rakeshii]MUV04263.1 hypothetical protein [Flavobacterium rakeshii]